MVPAELRQRAKEQTRLDKIEHRLEILAENVSRVFIAINAITERVVKIEEESLKKQRNGWYG